MTDFYRQSLTLLIELLKNEGYDNWIDWLKKDIELWETTKSTQHHLDAYGGMGSFNDVVIGDSSIIGVWKSKLFGTIQTLTYSFANENIQEAPTEEGFYRFGSQEISGWRCRKCGYARISDIDVERYLATMLFSVFFVENIKKDTLNNVLNLENIIFSDATKEKRERLIETIKTASIDYVNNGWQQNCLKCGSNDVCAYRWEITDEYSRLTAADDNLEINIHN